ncbi:MAG: hypothetical protein AAF438_00110 [Pseudomonadota bacterium]
MTFRFVFICLLSVLIQGCGGGGSGSTNPPPPPPSSSFNLAGFTVSSENGSRTDTLNFTWTISNPNNQTLTCTLDIFGNGDELLTIDNCATTQNRPVTYQVFGRFLPKITVSDGVSEQELIHTAVVAAPIIAPVFAPRPSFFTGNELCVHIVAALVTVATAEIGDISETLEPPLHCGGSRGGWSKTLDLSDMPSGEHILEIRVTTEDGRNWLFLVEVIINRLPQVEVSSPLEHTVLRPSGQLVASCNDPDNVAALTAFVSDRNGRNERAIAVSPNQQSVDVAFNPQEFEGQQIRLVIICTEDTGREVERVLTLNVDSSATLTQRVEVDGLILDFDDDQVLYQVPRDDGFFDFAILDINTEEVVPIPARVRSSHSVSTLTATGAIISAGVLLEWHNGALTELVPQQARPSMITGDFLIFTDEQGQWFRRQLSTQTNLPIPGEAKAVAESGVVAYVLDRDIFLWSDGNSTPIQNDTSSNVGSVVTDGARVAYTQSFTGALFLNESGVETQLSVNGRTPMLSDGWLAYLGFVTQQYQVFVRDPDGVETQRSFFGATLELVDGLGDTVFKNGGRRYWSQNGLPLLNVSSDLGFARSEPGTRSIAMGRSVFDVDLGLAQEVSTQGTISGSQSGSTSADGNALNVSFVSESTFEVVSVSVTVGSLTTDLMFMLGGGPTSGPSRFFGSLDISTLARGDYVATLLAEDGLGNSYETTIPFSVDRPPTVVTIAPLVGTVARPELAVHVRCQDDDPGTWTASFRVGGLVISAAPGVDLIDPALELAGSTNEFEATAACVDSAGQRTEEVINLFNDPSQTLTELESVNGPILDLTDTQILYWSGILDTPGVWLRDRTNGMEVEIPNDVEGVVGEGRITPTGAVYRRDGLRQSFRGRLVDWRNGNIEVLPGDRGAIEQINGDFMIWNSNDLAYRKRFSSGATNQLEPSFQQSYGFGVTTVGLTYFFDAAIFSSAVTPTIYTYDIAGNLGQAITDDQEFILRPQVTQDGTRFLYLTQGLPLQQGGIRTLKLYENGQETTIMGGIPNNPAPRYQSSGTDYKITGDWIVYNRFNGGPRDIWLRDIDGNQTQITFDSPTPPQIEELAANGEFTYILGGDRYLRRTDDSVEPISLREGTPYFINDTWYLVLGRSVFTIN